MSSCICPNINTRNHTLIRRGLSFFLIFKVGAGEVNLPLHRCHLDRIWVHLNIGAMQLAISWSSGQLRSNGSDIMISKNKKLLLDVNSMILIEWLRGVNYTWLHSLLTPLNPIPTQSRQIRQWRLRPHHLLIIVSNNKYFIFILFYHLNVFLDMGESETRPINFAHANSL
jgi:hypothetical protein